MKNQSLNAIFAYGTLTFNPVIYHLLDRKISGKPATIYGFKRVKIKDKRYPGLIKANSKLSVKGILYEGISPDEAELLDTYEDSFYQKIESEVKLSNGKAIKALVYTVPENNKKFISDSEWDIKEFADKHLEEYMVMVKKFRKNYLAGDRSSQEFY